MSLPRAPAAGTPSGIRATGTRPPRWPSWESNGNDRDPLTDHSMHRAADTVERLHDVRVVRAPEEPLRAAVVDRGVRELGYRAGGIRPAGAGEPRRLHGPVTRAAQDPAGSHHTRGVRTLCLVLHA